MSIDLVLSDATPLQKVGKIKCFSFEDHALLLNLELAFSPSEITQT